MPPTAPSANDLLMGSGIPAAKFVNVGDTVSGAVLVEPAVTQQSDFKTGKPVFYNDDPEQPAWQVVVTVQTDVRDPSIEGDDGKRKFYLKNQLKQAVSEAVKASGAKMIQVGGVLSIRFTHEIPGSGNPAKQYEAHYVPAPSAASTELGLAPLGQAAATGLAPLGAAAPVATQAASAPLAATATPSVAAAALAAQQAAATVAPTGVDPALAALIAANPALAAALAAAAPVAAL